MGYIIPGVYDIDQKVGSYSPNVTSNVNFLVGSAQWGPTNEVVSGGINTILRTFQDGDICNFVRRMVKNAGSDLSFRVVRVLGSGSAKSTLDVEASEATVGTFNAKYYGANGDNIYLKIETGSLDSTKKISVKYKTYVLGYVDNVEDGAGLKSALEDSPNLSDYVEYVNTTETLPENMDWTALASGANGSSIANTDIVGTYDAGTGVRTGMQLAVTGLDWHNIATCTLEGDATINTGMKTVCNARGQVGKGKAFCTHEKTDTISTIKSAMSSLKDATYRVAYFAGWIYSDVDSDYVSSVASMMGWVCSLPIFESCGNRKLQDATAVYNEYDRAQVEELIAAGANVVTKDIDSGSSIKSYHSQLLTSHTDVTEIQDVAVKDYANEKIRTMLEEFVSRPNKIRTSVGNRLIDKLQRHGNHIMNQLLSEPSVWGNGVIDDGFVICDDTNNTSETAAAKQLIFDWGIRFISAAHYIVNRITATSGDLSSITIEETIR
jgi:hypothetical protein